MISAKRAIQICLNPNRQERERLIDNLSENDAKYMLKIALRTIITEEKHESESED